MTITHQVKILDLKNKKMYHHSGVTLRPIGREDSKWLLELHNDWETLQHLTDSRPVDEKQQDMWVERMMDSSSSMRMAVLTEHEHIDIGLRSNDPVGCIRLDRIDYLNKSILVGGDIVKRCRGRGYGSKMFSSMLSFIFNVLNMRRAYLSVLETNSIAISLYKKFGFKEEGRETGAVVRNGKEIDYISMYLMESEYRKNEPRR
jgi:RimJ/RimL family protein N-acetyltransferase